MHFSLKIWHLVATILMIFLRTNWPNFVYMVTFYSTSWFAGTLQYQRSGSAKQYLLERRSDSKIFAETAFRTFRHHYTPGYELNSNNVYWYHPIFQAPRISLCLATLRECQTKQMPRSEELPLWRTGGDHQDALVLRGWKLSSRTWNPITSLWMKQLMWLRIVHCGDWCLCFMHS